MSAPGFKTAQLEEPETAQLPPQTTANRNQVFLLLTSVFLIYLGQTTLNPIIAPLSREVGLAEWQIGVTISAAAVMVVATSQYWGRLSQSWGRKPVLMAAYVLAVTTMVLFAMFSWLGTLGTVAGVALFLLFVLLRGVGFGTAIAAVAPTAQAYIADITPDEQARVKGMAGIGATQGIAMIGGSVLGGLLSAFGVLTPLVSIPLILIAGLLVLTFGLRRESRHELVASPAQVPFHDPRVWPFLLAGFGLFTSLGFIQVVTGFIVQDRLGLDARATGMVTGGVLLAAGIGLIFSQTVVVPRCGWPPPTLLRVGGIIGFVGFGLLALDFGPIMLFLGMLFIGLGLGTAMPGYTAGPTLLVSREEQGGLAGLIGATNGLTFVVAPTLSTTLYGVWDKLPILVSTIVMGLVVAFVFTHPRFRQLSK